MLIAFDYDGVIVNSLEQHTKAVSAAGKILGSTRTITLQDIEQMQDVTFASAGRILNIPEEKIPSFVGKVFELLLIDSTETEVFAGIPEAIRKIAEKHRIVIITSSIKAKVDQVLTKHNLESCIHKVIDGTNPAPKSEKISRCTAEMQIDPNQVVMIGDAISDIRQGKLAGAKTIAVTWGFQPISILQRECPDYIANSPNEIFDIVLLLDKSPTAISCPQYPVK